MLTFHILGTLFGQWGFILLVLNCVYNIFYVELETLSFKLYMYAYYLCDFK